MNKFVQIIVFILITLVAMAAGFIFNLLNKKWEKFKNLNYWVKQIVIGLTFSGFVILLFFFGIKFQKIITSDEEYNIIGTYSSVNAIAMIPGFTFGFPAGLITGVVGAIARAFQYPFGSGDFLRISESIVVLISGVLPGFFRSKLFNNKSPKWFFGLPISLLLESFHMLFMFTIAFSQKDVNYAYAVIGQCDIVILISSLLTLSLFFLSINLFEKEYIFIKTNNDRLSNKIRTWMVYAFTFFLILTFSFNVFAYTQKANRDTKNDEINSVVDIEQQILASIIEEEKYDWTDTDLKALCYTRRVGHNGYTMILDADNNDLIISVGSNTLFAYGKEFFYFNNIDDDFNTQQHKITELEENKVHKIVLQAQEEIIPKIYTFYVLYQNFDTKDASIPITYKGKDMNFRILSILPYDEVERQMGLAIRLTGYIEMLVLMFIYALIYNFIKIKIINRITLINKGCQAITNGNLDYKINVNDSYEFRQLSNDINKTVESLKFYINEADRRIEAELLLAKQIQSNALPMPIPYNPRLDLAATMVTAKSVGGDFYDYFYLDKNHILFLIADVSGKGIPAAMFMMKAKSLIKSFVNFKDISLGEAITKVNNELCINNAAGMFVTSWIGILNLSNGEIEFVNAGHNSPIIKENNKFIELRTPVNFVLAGMNDINYNSSKITLKEGDEILLYTDGVTEATNKSNKLYSLKRLIDFANKVKYKSSQGFLTKTLEEVNKFQNGCEQADDITMLMIRYKPSLYREDHEITINPNLNEVKNVVDFISKNLKIYSIDQKTKSRIELSISEILENIIKNGYDSSSENQKPIEIIFRCNINEIEINFKYGPMKYDILKIPSLKVKNNEVSSDDFEKLGMAIIQNSTHKISYKFENKTNSLTIVRKLNF